MLINRSAVREMALRLGNGRISQVSPEVFEACDRAVLVLLQRAIAQQSKSSPRLAAPVDKIAGEG